MMHAQAQPGLSEPVEDRPLARSRSLLVLVLALAGCGPVDLPVITVPDGGEVMNPGGRSCASSDDCMAGQLCDKAACGDALGRCIPRPPTCDTESRPTCGCDGVTYWNDCLRRAAGVESFSERGPCRTGLACDTTSPCPSGVSCARIVFPNECGRVGPGQCWLVPQACSTPVPEHYFACGEPQTQCLDFCGAVRREQPTAKFPGPCP